MFTKVLYATSPDSMRDADAATLRDRYLLTNLFAENAVSLSYSHI